LRVGSNLCVNHFVFIPRGDSFIFEAHKQNFAVIIRKQTK